MLTCRWVQMCLIVVEIDVIYGWRIFIQLYKEMLSWEYLFCQLPRGTLNEQLSSVLSGDSDIPECILLISTSEWQGQVIVKHLLLMFYLKYVVGLLLGISISLQIQIFFFFLRKKLTKLIGLVMNTRSNPNHGFYANRGLHEFSMRGLI